MNDVQPKTEKNFLNVLKVFFAICIVSIHTSFLCDVDQTIYVWVNSYINSIAVPFFFVVAGFFF